MLLGLSLLDKGHLSWTPASRTPSLVRGTPSSSFEFSVRRENYVHHQPEFRVRVFVSFRRDSIALIDWEVLFEHHIYGMVVGINLVWLDNRLGAKQGRAMFF